MLPRWRRVLFASAVLVGALGLAACVPCPPPPEEPTTSTTTVSTPPTTVEEPIVCILEEGVDCSPPTTLHHDR